ncbi:phosphoglucosamine mutase [Candidatus Micrarchaeota archaeon]|nr:phosphoglucosamine mutase [Candidatus Micrarchaeota archaeon]MBD3417907.1 phosphoglucosamine mutase [Candidatus Micrarchaeota archaeon]
MSSFMRITSSITLCIYVLKLLLLSFNSMFGTSGIRGLYGSEITPELALKIANAFSYQNLVVGRDTRTTGPVLERAAFTGAMCAGRDSISVGVVPTPVLSYATLKYKCNGIMVTASHNPPEYNGLKLISAGKEINKQEEKKVLSNYENGVKLAAWDKNGKLIPDVGITEAYTEFIFPQVDSASISKKKPKVAIDCNGAGAIITPILLRKLGCEVITLNTQEVGFQRPSEPSEKNLSALKSKVKEVGADLGLAHDGDGDRVALIDENGEFVNMDVQLSLMILHELEKKKGKVVSTVESSLIIKDAVEQGGGELIITPVGSTYVGDTLEKEGAVFGGEPAGEFIYSQGVHVPDGVLGAAKFVEIFAKKGKISELTSRFSPYPMVREKYKTTDRKAAMEKILGSISIEGEVSKVDGIRIDSEDYWLLIRPSGTEPIIRLTLEAKTKERLEEIHAEAKKLIESSV